MAKYANHEKYQMFDFVDVSKTHNSQDTLFSAGVYIQIHLTLESVEIYIHQMEHTWYVQLFNSDFKHNQVRISHVLEVRFIHNSHVEYIVLHLLHKYRTLPNQNLSETFAICTDHYVVLCTVLLLILESRVVVGYQVWVRVRVWVRVQ